MPALGLAPALGWAVFAVLATPVLTAIGFGPGTVRLLGAAALAAAALGLRGTRPGARLPAFVLPLAALIAALPAFAILPKPVPGGLLLGPPLFDHVKIAIEQAILRQGLPVDNPFVGPGVHVRLAYYVLWHASAAMLAAATGAAAWTADAAMTAFTAFASLALMMALAIGWAGRPAAAALVAPLALAASLRHAAAGLLGSGTARALVQPDADFGAWLDQSAWVPQHLASACCTLLAILALQRLARDRGLLPAILLALLVAAAFESSAWIGGIAFAVAGSLAGLVLLRDMPAPDRLRFLGRATLATALAGALLRPGLLADAHALAARHAGPGLALLPYPVLGTLAPAVWRPALNVAAFWLLLLPWCIPALLPAGLPGLRRAGPLGLFALLCLATAWLGRSTLDNNDLGWRAVLPAILVLIPAAAAALTRPGTGALRAATLLAGLATLPQTVWMLGLYAHGQRPGDAAGLTLARQAWAAMRLHTSPTDRVLNNPLAVQAATPWPVNIGWALFSDRPSCYAGWSTVIAYGALPPGALRATRDRIARVFAGTAGADDLARLDALGCRAVLITQADGAWTHDPLAGAAGWSVGEETQAFRIWQRK